MPRARDLPRKSELGPKAFLSPLHNRRLWEITFELKARKWCPGRVINVSPNVAISALSPWDLGASHPLINTKLIRKLTN